VLAKKRKGAILQRVGEVIGPDVATKELIALRTRQVGRKAAAATITRCEGRWMDQPEPTLVCEIKFFPSPRETHTTSFERHVSMLAEKLAERLGQQEVIVEMNGQTYRANAPNERGPEPLRPHGKRIR